MPPTHPRILVVDDHPDIQALASMVLEAEGFRVRTAGTGLAALEVLEEDEVDLVLLDINMPEMDGWEALRLIRADERLADLPVVMFSVKGEMHDKVHSLQEGAQAFVTKPFRAEDLLATLRRVLSSHGSGRER
jgi:CheY-like chemotaxis protein